MQAVRRSVRLLLHCSLDELEQRQLPANFQHAPGFCHGIDDLFARIAMLPSSMLSVEGVQLVSKSHILVERQDEIPCRRCGQWAKEEDRKDERDA